MLSRWGAELPYQAFRDSPFSLHVRRSLAGRLRSSAAVRKTSFAVATGCADCPALMERRHFLARISRIAAPPARFFLGLRSLGILLGRDFPAALTWRETNHLRYQRDIVNGFYWGTQTLVEGHRFRRTPDRIRGQFSSRGYLGLYERVADDAYEQNYYLDYPPLRLLVMSIWAREVRAKFPGAEDGTPDYVEPLLVVNTVCELITAAGNFSACQAGCATRFGRDRFRLACIDCPRRNAAGSAVCSPRASRGSNHR